MSSWSAGSVPGPRPSPFPCRVHITERGLSAGAARGWGAGVPDGNPSRSAGLASRLHAALAHWLARLLPTLAHLPTSRASASCPHHGPPQRQGGWGAQDTVLSGGSDKVGHTKEPTRRGLADRNMTPGTLLGKNTGVHHMPKCRDPLTTPGPGSTGPTVSASGPTLTGPLAEQGARLSPRNWGRPTVWRRADGVSMDGGGGG